MGLVEPLQAAQLVALPPTILAISGSVPASYYVPTVEIYGV